MTKPSSGWFILWCEHERSNKPGTQSTHWDPAYPSLIEDKAPKLPKIFSRNCKPPCHSQGGICCDMTNHMPWIYCYPFNMHCRYIWKVQQARDRINTLGSCPSKPRITRALTQTLIGTTNHCIILSVVWVVTWIMNRHMPWICCHSFHMSCECMKKVSQAFNTVNTLGSFLSEP